MELVYKITTDDFDKTINEIVSKKFNFSNRLLILGLLSQILELLRLI